MAGVLAAQTARLSAELKVVKMVVRKAAYLALMKAARTAVPMAV